RVSAAAKASRSRARRAVRKRDFCMLIPFVAASAGWDWPLVNLGSEEATDDVLRALRGPFQGGSRFARSLDHAGFVLAADGAEDLDQVGGVVHPAGALGLHHEINDVRLLR